TYTFSGGVSASGYCETAVADRKSITFTVNALPTAPTLASTNVNVCEGTPAVLTVTNPQPGLTYHWYNANGDLQGSGTPFTTVNINSNTTFQVEAVSESGCASARTTINISITAAPAAPVSGSVTNGPVCIGSPAILRVDNPVAGIIYRWYTDMTGGTLLHEGE